METSKSDFSEGENEYNNNGTTFETNEESLKGTNKKEKFKKWINSDTNLTDISNIKNTENESSSSSTEENNKNDNDDNNNTEKSEDDDESKETKVILMKREINVYYLLKMLKLFSKIHKKFLELGIEYMNFMNINKNQL